MKGHYGITSIWDNYAALKRRSHVPLVFNDFAVVDMCLRIFIARTSSRRNMPLIIVDIFSKCNSDI